jgi:hypothetical protein
MAAAGATATGTTLRPAALRDLASTAGFRRVQIAEGSGSLERLLANEQLDDRLW